MKKSLLSLATLVAASALSMAADCAGTDSNITACTADTDCAAGEICDTTAEQCVTPECAEDTDCDLQDAGAGSPIADTADFANGCEAEDYVTIVGFDGLEYCALVDDADFSCADDLDGEEVAVTAELAAGGTATVCVLADGTCDATSGSCS